MCMGACAWVRACVCVCVRCASQGLVKALTERFNDWCFNIDEITLEADTHIPIHEQPAALRAALQQLRALHAPAAQVTFNLWGRARLPHCWSAELGQVLSEVQPTLTHLTIPEPRVWEGTFSADMWP